MLKLFRSIFNGHPIRIVYQVACATLALAGLAYITRKSILSTDTEIDFRYFWIAGRLIIYGIEPYGPLFTDLGHKLVPAGNALKLWAYPPQWWGLCYGLGHLGLHEAVAVWRSISAALFISGTFFIAFSLRKAGAHLSWWTAAAICGLSALIQAVPISLAMGQSSLFVYFGFCFVLGAVINGSRLAMIVGLTIVCMKPQFGGVICLGLLSNREWRISVICSIGLSALLSLPQIIEFGIAETAIGFLRNAKAYSSFFANTPVFLTGSAHVFWLATGKNLPVWITLSLGTLLTWLACYNPPQFKQRPGVQTAAILLGICCFFVPLHNYDMVLIAPLMLLASALDVTSAILALSALVLAYHPSFIDEALGLKLRAGPLSSGILPLTGASIIAFTLSIFLLLRSQSSRGGQKSLIRTAPHATTLPAD